ncbi:MAG: Rrf2 family transcriptional regulator [Spirochaetaceae bacterium]|jgi:Rrf2 family protein|nr:Rrf2 family transcriptional regulator [Spirochaetaceae bacterium]
MLITVESDYAVRILRALVDGGRKTVEAICAAELIPRPYGYKILKKLEKGGIVRSFRGINGGYALERGLETVTLYDVFTAVDGDILLTGCVDTSYLCPRNTAGRRCAVHAEFGRLQSLLTGALREKSLAEILAG